MKKMLKSFDMADLKHLSEMEDPALLMRELFPENYAESSSN